MKRIRFQNGTRMDGTNGLYERAKSGDHHQFMYKSGRGLTNSNSAHELQENRVGSSFSQSEPLEPLDYQKPGFDTIEILNLVDDSRKIKNFRAFVMDQQIFTSNDLDKQKERIRFQKAVKYSRYREKILLDQTQSSFKLNPPAHSYFETSETSDYKIGNQVESHGTWGNLRNLNDRQVLCLEWAGLNRWFRHQPLWLIRKYFGPKIGMYFAWLEFYTLALVAPAVLGNPDRVSRINSVIE